jgi:hypothetical protein
MLGISAQLISLRAGKTAVFLQLVGEQEQEPAVRIREG